MKKIIVLTIMAMLVASAAYALTTVSQGASATIGTAMSIEFASTTDTTFGGGNIVWAAVDPSAGSHIAPDSADRTGLPTAKMDTAVICKYNNTQKWQLKMYINGGTLAGKVRFYEAKPVRGATAGNGTMYAGQPVPAGSNWPFIPTSDTAIYTSGTNDTINTPFGSFCGISYALDPTGLSSGTTATGTINYTIVQVP